MGEANMVEIIIDSAMIETILAILAPVIALIITNIKKKLGYEQGDMAFNQLKNWAEQLDELSNIFTELKPISSELTILVDDARQIWNDPADNSVKLTEIFIKANKLYTEAMILMKNYKNIKGENTLADVLKEAA
jgi:hypothetical protein